MHKNLLSLTIVISLIWYDGRCVQLQRQRIPHLQRGGGGGNHLGSPRHARLARRITQARWGVRSGHTFVSLAFAFHTRTRTATLLPTLHIALDAPASALPIPGGYPHDNLTKRPTRSSASRAAPFGAYCAWALNDCLLNERPPFLSHP